MTAREEVLSRIRGALGEQPQVPDIPRAYRCEGEHQAGSPELVAMLVDRLEDYRATVVRVPAADDDAVAQAVADALAPVSAGDAGQVIAPPGVPRDWTHTQNGAIVDDGSLDATALDQVAAVVTGSVVAIAETGTIVLDGGPLCGRRAITLVPDVHVCVVRAADVVQTVPEALPRLDPTRPLTFISGPSATSDIELNRVEGVHGPRTLIVILAG